MVHTFAFALCLAGFAALAFSVDRQQRDLFRHSLREPVTRALRVGGAGALLLALGVLVAGQGWSFGLVMFSGHTTLAAGIVYCALIGFKRRHAGGAAPRRRASLLP